MEYVAKDYTKATSEDIKVIAQPLYRKFNMDGLNDYCQMAVKTGCNMQHEILIIIAYLAHSHGWDTMSILLHISISPAE